MTRHRIIIGDCRRMAEVATQSIHLVVTSPPYWQLKDYGPPEQIGYHDSYETYINHLNLVWQECARVLLPGCRLCINIGDQFARAAYYGRYKIIPIRTEIIRFCETIGLDYLGAIIWQKVTTCNTSGGATIMGSFPFPRNGMLKLDYEFILIFKKPGQTPPPSPAAKEQSRLSLDDWNAYFRGHWVFPGEKQIKHLAMFPEELPRRLIRMFTFMGETVLDPFLGSGTTSLAAKNLGRHSVGYEINAEFLPIIREKLGVVQGTIWPDATVRISRQKAWPKNWEALLQALPYRFQDPVQVTHAAKPQEQSYGSKIHAASLAREEFFRVREILSPTRLLLSDGREVPLLGVQEVPAKNGEAIDFLTKMCLGKKVFLRRDPHLPPECEAVYVYLANKTLLNAHLLKKKLAAVDAEKEYRLKKRFLKYCAG
ncbi:MAG: DNA-methyltransferase [Desulfobacca sp.]|uniref:DNA-methyltransferase n=1 Tax=Desulfobacca sp. TaxID=2067990 RepID=UPI00404AF7BC